MRGRLALSRLWQALYLYKLCAGIINLVDDADDAVPGQSCWRGNFANAKCYSVSISVYRARRERSRDNW